MECKKYNVAVLAGDGIGPEVCEAGRQVMQAAAEKDGHIAFTFTDHPWGCTYYKETGRMMPEDGLEILKNYDAILLGAVGRPDVPDHISLRGLLLTIRQGFDQYVNLRPVKLLKGAPCPLKDVKREDIDMIFVREKANTPAKACWKRTGRNRWASLPARDASASSTTRSNWRSGRAGTG